MRVASKRSTPAELKRTNESEQIERDYPATSTGIIDMIQGLESQNRRKKN